MRRSLPQLMFAVLVLALLLLREAKEPPLAGVEETFVNWLAANSNGEHIRAPVMLVEINDNCMLYYPLPWSPLNYASFLDGALAFHARVAAIEPVLQWDEQNLSPEQALEQPQYEKLLHYRILQTPKLELGAHLGFPDDPDVLPPLQPMPILRDVHGAVDAVPEYTSIEGEPNEDLRLTAALGFTNVPPTEATAQHAPLVFRYRGQMVPSFVLEAMMLWYGATPDDVQVRLGSEIRIGDKLSIPVNESGAMLVDWKQPYDRAGFDDLVLSVDQLEHQHAAVIPPDQLKDRLVILARTDDQSKTMLLPTGRMGSAGELFAEAIATAEMNAFAKPVGWTGSALVVVLGLALAYAVAVRHRLLAVPVALALMAAYLLLCLGVFETTRGTLPLTPMLGVVIFVTVFRLLDGGVRLPAGLNVVRPG